MGPASATIGELSNRPPRMTMNKAPAENQRTPDEKLRRAAGLRALGEQYVGQLQDLREAAKQARIDLAAALHAAKACPREAARLEQEVREEWCRRA